MTKLKWACLLALPLLASPSQVRADGCCLLPPINVNAKLNWQIKGTVGCTPFSFGGAAAGPWYSYFPYEAYFQTPAPYGTPYWPMAVPTAAYPGAATGYPTQLPPPQPAAVRPAAYQPVGYQQVGYQAEAPAYWYGK